MVQGVDRPSLTADTYAGSRTYKGHEQPHIHPDLRPAFRFRYTDRLNSGGLTQGIPDLQAKAEKALVGVSSRWLLSSGINVAATAIPTGRRSFMVHNIDGSDHRTEMRTMTPKQVQNSATRADNDRHVAKLIREWAKANNVTVADKGAVPKAVRTQWIETHKGLNNGVIAHSLLQDRATKRWDRYVDVLCYRCAGVHHHGASGGPGKRLAPEQFHRVAHCAGEHASQTGGYYVEDQLPVDDNEKAMAEANEQLGQK